MADVEAMSGGPRTRTKKVAEGRVTVVLKVGLTVADRKLRTPARGPAKFGPS